MCVGMQGWQGELGGTKSFPATNNGIATRAQMQTQIHMKAVKQDTKSAQIKKNINATWTMTNGGDVDFIYHDQLIN